MCHAALCYELAVAGPEDISVSLTNPSLNQQTAPTPDPTSPPAASKVKGSSRPGGPGGGAFVRRTRSKVDEARDILANVVLCHVPVLHFDYQQKVGCCGWVGGEQDGGAVPRPRAAL